MCNRTDSDVEFSILIRTKKVVDPTPNDLETNSFFLVS